MVADVTKLWEQTVALPPAGLDCETTHVTYRPREPATTIFEERPAPASAPSPGPAPAPYPGYEVLGELGRGGMGIVYRARQKRLGREVAIKRIRPDVVRSPGVRTSFLAEAIATGSLDHPNIVPIHELAGEGDDVFFSLKLVDGRSWHEILAGGVDPERDLGVLLGVTNAVAFAHSRGVAHRDLKPENVMVGSFGEVLVMDWGLAVDFRPDPDPPRARPRATIDAPAGTPCYMAPELAEGRRDVGPATDVYLLGGILHRLLAGRPPHAGKNLRAVLLSAVRSEPPVLPPGTPAELAAICRRALAERPEDRYPDAKAFRDAVAGFLAHRESHAVAAAAEAELARCAPAKDAAPAPREERYTRFAEAIAGFRQALVLWEGNEAARAGERRARSAFARAALEAGDLGLAASQLEALSKDAEGRGELAARLETARRERERTARSARRMRVALAATVLATIASLAAGLVGVSREQTRTSQARDAERDARILAERERRAADDSRRRAERNLARAYFADGRAALDAAETGRAEVYLARSLALDDTRATREQLLEARLRSPRFAWAGASRAPATAVAWSPDGRIFATGADDIELWDARSGAELRRLHGHVALTKRVQYMGRLVLSRLDSITRLAFSPDGGRLASAGEDRIVLLHDVATGEEALALRGHERGVKDVSFSPDGERLATASADGTIRLWDAATGAAKAVLRGHEGAVHAVRFDPAGRRLASGGADGTVRVRDLDRPDAPRLLARMPKDRAVTALEWSRDGALIAVVGESDTLLLLDAVDGRRVASLECDERWCHVAFSADGRLAASALEGTIHLLDARTGKEQRTLAAEGASASLAFSPDGARLLGGGGITVVWDVATGERVLESSGHHGPVQTIAASPRGDTVATGGIDGTVRLWDAHSGAERAILGDPGETNVTGVAFGPDGSWLVAAHQGGTVRVWDTAARKARRTIEMGNPNLVEGLAVDPSGERFAVSNDQGMLRVYARRTGKKLVDVGSDGVLRALAWSPDGSTLAGGGSYGVISSSQALVWLHDAATGRQLGSLRGHDQGISAVAWSPDGKLLASASLDKTIRFWDVAKRVEETWRRLRTKDVPTSLAWSPDGALVLTGSRDWGPLGPAHVYSVLAAKEVFSAGEWAYCSAFAPDGRSIFVAAERPERWDLEPPPELRAVYTRHRGASCVAFSPDGRTLATGGFDKVARLWDVATLESRAELHGNDSSVQDVAFSPDGARLATAGADGAIRIFDAATHALVATFADKPLVAGSQARIAWSPDGRLIAHARGVDDVRVRDATTGAEVVVVHEPGAPAYHATGVAFVRSSGLLATSAGDRTVHFWDVKTGALVRTLASDGGAGGVARTSVIAFGPGDRLLAVASEDTAVLLRDLEAGSAWPLRGHGTDLAVAAFAPDGRALATVARETLHIFALPDAVERLALRVTLSSLTGVAFSPSGHALATVGRDGALRVWDLAALERLAARDPASFVAPAEERSGLQLVGAEVVPRLRNRLAPPLAAKRD